MTSNPKKRPKEPIDFLTPIELHLEATHKKPLSAKERNLLLALAEDLQVLWGVSPVAVLQKAFHAEVALQVTIPNALEVQGEIPVATLVELLQGKSCFYWTDLIFSPTFLEWLLFLRNGATRDSVPAWRHRDDDLDLEVGTFLNWLLPASRIVNSNGLGTICDAIARRQTGGMATRRKISADKQCDESLWLIYKLTLKTLSEAQKRIPRTVTAPDEISRQLETMGVQPEYLVRFTGELVQFRTTLRSSPSYLKLAERAALFVRDLEVGDGSGAFLPRRDSSANDLAGAMARLKTLEKSVAKMA